MKESNCRRANVREGKRYDVGWQEEAEAASPRLSRRTLITIIYNMYARTYACPGATDFFFYLYIFTPKSERQYAVWTYLVHLCFLLSVRVYVCMCVRVFTCVAFTTIFLICLLFRGFFFSSIIWFSYFFLSHNNTLSDFLFVRSFYPRFTSHSPFLSLFFFGLYSIFPPLFPSHENYPETRESKRDRERYEEEGFVKDRVVGG